MTTKIFIFFSCHTKLGDQLFCFCQAFFLLSYKTISGSWSWDGFV
jgi:Zn-finger protein